MAVRYIRIKVAGNLKHSQASPRCIDFSYEKTFGEAISTGTIILKRTGAWGTDDNDYVSGKTVQVWMSDTLVAGEVVENSSNIVFSGYITDPQFDSWKITLKCADRLWLAKLQENTTATPYSNTSVKTIWQAIIDRVESQSGLTFNTSINATATSPANLDKYDISNSNCYEKLWELANIVGWQFYYDVTNDVVVFEPKGTPTQQEFANKASYGVVWTGKTVNVVGLINWSSDSNDLTNDLNLIGGQSEVTNTQQAMDTAAGTRTIYTFNGSYATPPDSKANNIYNVTVESLSPAHTFVQGVDYVVYASSSPPGFINFLSAPTGYNTLYFTYTYKLSASTGTSSNDATSISNYIRRTKTVNKRNIVSSTDVSSYITNLLSGFKNPFTEINFEVNDTLIVPSIGAKVSVYDGVIGRQILYTDTPYPFIISTTKHWPSPTTSVRVSTKPLKYEERDQTIYDDLKKVNLELTSTNSKTFLRTDGTVPLQGDLVFGKIVGGTRMSQLVSPVIHKLSTAPTATESGQMYYDTTANKMYYRNSSAWVDMTGGTVGTGTQNRLTKWATTTTLGDSLLIDNGSNLAFKYASYSGTGAHISNDVNGTIIITVPSGQKVKFVAA